MNVWIRKGVVNAIQSFLSQHFPADVVARWWYVLLIGPAAGLIFGLITDVSLFDPVTPVTHIVEGPPSEIQVAAVAAPQGWKTDVFFLALGAIIAAGVVYILEEIRRSVRNPPSTD